MRFDVNLASQPYQDVRVFLLRWGTAAGALAMFTLVLVGAAFSGWWGARDVQQKIDLASSEMQQLDQDKVKAETLLGHAQNHAVLERSRFVNGLIARKAFSWTQLFMDLEKIMPARVHVVSLQPEAEENQVALRLLVEGDSREHALDLVRRMEASQRFRLARVKSEHGNQESHGTQLEIIAYYAPDPGRGAP